MLKIIKSSVRDTFIYSIGTFSTKLAGFVLVPIYTNNNYISSNDFGVLNLVEANMQFLTTVFGLGLCYAYERWYWDTDYMEKRKSIFFTILVVTLGLSVILGAVLFPTAGYFSNLLFEGAGYSTIFRLMVVNAALEIMAQTPNSLIRLNERPGLYTIANLAKLVVSIVATLVFVVYEGFGLEGVYYAQLTGIVAYFIILSGFLLRHIQPTFEGHVLGDMLKFRLPFLLPVVALNIFNFNDRLVLSKLNGLVDAGIYSLGSKLANTIKVFVITAIWLALTPTIYKMMNQPNNKRFYSKVMTYMGFTVLICVMFFSFYSEEIVALLAKDPIYLAAAQVIPVVSLGLFFGMLKDVSLIGLNITKKTGAMAITTFGVSLLSVGLNLLLIPYFGILGSALSNLLVQIVFFVIIYSVAQRHYEIPYELGKIGMMVVVAGGLFALTYLTHPFSIFIRIPVKLLLIGLFPIILYWFGFYEPIELDRMHGFWRKWKSPGRWAKNIQELVRNV